MNLSKLVQMQDSPNTIKIEATLGCNLRCAMCGIRGIRERAGPPYFFLSILLAEQLAQAISTTCWNSKIEFALRGEPLLNPNLAAIIQILRTTLPTIHLMVCSNATPLLRPPGVVANMDRLFAAGLNLLVLDNYRTSRKATDQVRAYKNAPVTGYGKVDGVPAGPSPYHKVRANVRRVIIIEDFEVAALATRHVGTKHLNNNCGAAYPPLAFPLVRRCAWPFREMTIRWDGRLAFCCVDWRDYLDLGTINDYPSLTAAWNQPVWQAGRRKLYHRQRDFIPCRWCNERTFRDGLLPDKLGKTQLPQPTTEDNAVLARALQKGPGTMPVLRDWETSPHKYKQTLFDNL